MNLGSNFFHKMEGRLVAESEDLSGLVSIPMFSEEDSFFPRFFRNVMGLDESVEILEVLTNKEQTKVYTSLTFRRGKETKVVIREYGFVNLFFGFIAFLNTYKNG